MTDSTKEAKDDLKDIPYNVDELSLPPQGRLDELSNLSLAAETVDPVKGLDFRSAVADYQRALIVAALRAAKGSRNGRRNC